MKFGRLTVLRRAGSTKRGQAQWLCQCDCGSDPKVIVGSCLRNGHTQSCGCIHKEGLSNLRATHRESHTRLYNIWKSIKARCYNSNNHAYDRYGGRGIVMCDEWKHNYVSFRDWALDNGYDNSLSIDRIDVNGIYSPQNCRWADDYMQANNKRDNHNIEINGEVKTMKEWCDHFGTRYGLVRDRISVLHWEPERALTTPPRPCRPRSRTRVKEMRTHSSSSL